MANKERKKVLGQNRRNQPFVLDQIGNPLSTKCTEARNDEVSIEAN
jgi:hypothetical protein